MRITIANDAGQTFGLDLDASMELADVRALLEAESGIAPADQILLYAGRQLTDDRSTLEAAGLREDDVLLLRSRNVGPSSPPSVAGRDVNSDAEAMRQQVLNNPTLMAQLRQSAPQLADAAGDATRFREVLGQLSAMQESARLQQQREQELLAADPYDIEAQKKIEEAIRQERVLENLESAMENMPESFGTVTMLYCKGEVNGHAVTAFVDSGAQGTIMSPECAERCGIMRLIDTRFAGVARGVGTAKILGRVHSAQIKLGDELFLQTSFMIMEGRGVDLLFGLDMLKRHQAVIDLGKNALVIAGHNVPFLAEHEIPKAFEDADDAEQLAQAGASPGAAAASSSRAALKPPFPGSGNTLGGAGPGSTSTPTPTAAPAPTQQASAAFPEESIASVMALGVPRDEAVRALEAANGNVEVAASLIFGGM